MLAGGSLSDVGLVVFGIVKLLLLMRSIVKLLLLMRSKVISSLAPSIPKLLLKD